MQGGAVEVDPIQGYFGKRLFDIVGALVLLAIFSIKMLRIYSHIVQDSPGDPIFRQKRVGQCGRPYTILKFRTMYVGSARHDDLVRPGDERTTRVGARLRPTHLDELPQLINVLRGEMSLVGPRAFTIEKYAKRTSHDPRWRQVFAAKPGLVGSICLRGKIEELEAADPQFDWVEEELMYQRTQSLLLDVRMLWQATLKVVREWYKARQARPTTTQVEFAPVIMHRH
jgi:lipopolysaccharide/colanic/teichoic acid biosynthesis glycosyltransferase